MSDLEQDIRDLLTEEVRSAPPPHEPDRAVRRTRRRQVLTVAGSVLGVLALGAASIAGVRAVLTTGNGTPADAPTTTTTVNGISMLHPEDWYVVDPDEAGLNAPAADPTADLPRLVLAVAPFDPGELFACPGMAETPHTFLMTIEEQPLALAGDAARLWPVELEPLDVDASESACYPEWSFSQAMWTVGGRTFHARIGFAPEASDPDRDALIDAFSSMRFEPVEGAPAAAVLDVGEIGGEAWELIASRDDEGLVLSLETEDAGSGIGGFVVGSRDLQFAEMVVGSGDGARLVVFGAVPPGTARIDCPDPASLRTLDVPDAIDDRFEAFLAVLDVGLETELHAVDADGNVIASGRVGRTPNDHAETPPEEPARPAQVRPEQGGTYWGVYLAAARSFDHPAVEAGRRRAEELGYTATAGDVACDQGAAAELGLKEGSAVIAVYFGTNADASAAFALFDPPPLGVAKVTTYCLD